MPNSTATAHGAGLVLWLRRQRVAALTRPQADALHRKRGVEDEEERDGRDASDVEGVAARADAAAVAAEGRRGASGGAAGCWTDLDIYIN